MTDDDDALLAHYIDRGAEPWNTSLAAAWLDYELRAWVLPRLPGRRPLAVCNIGIGVGLWDDWLGHVLSCSITSIDRDPAICGVFELRQRREAHPHPAKVICGDVLDDALAARRFDVITAVGSTASESGDRARFVAALRGALAPDGRLLLAEVGQGPPPAAHTVKKLDALWLALSMVES